MTTREKRPIRQTSGNGRASAAKSKVSELDEYIHMGEAKEEEEDVFSDIEEEEDDDESAPLPRIARDIKLEEEIEAEKYVPVEKVIEDVPELGQALDPVRMYLREIGRHALLTGEEEVSLAKRIELGLHATESLEDLNADGDVLDGSPEDIDFDELDRLRHLIRDGKLAQDQLAQSNLRLVVSVAKRYIGRGLNFQDLIQEGNVGLLRAVEKFDHSLGFKFSTYATWWIRQAVTRAIADQGRTIRVPVHMYEQINRLTRTSRQLVQELGRDPTTDEIAEELGVTPRKVEHIMRVSQRPLSLEMPVGEEEDSYLGDFIEDEDADSPQESAGQQLLREVIDEIFSSLTPREVRILQLRFGLVDGYCYTLEEVGKKFGVTRERIRQIEAQALSRLRHPSRSRKLRDYL